MINKTIQYIDNSPLILFRIFFGFLIACESFGAILTGWVRNNMVDVKYTFSHIHLDFLQYLVGPQMYVYFALMGVTGIGIMLGYRYKLNMIAFTVLWSGAYLLQKTSYNNHYYLLVLVSFLMCFLPANRYASIDVKQGRVNEEYVMPRYISRIFILQVAIVYLFGTLAKFYPDWLDGTFVRIMYSDANIPDSFKAMFATESFSLVISYLGILFDGLIVFLLLYKPTRTLGFIAALIFHIFNSITLQIGIFPFFALSFGVFFYDPEQIRKMFFKKKTPVVANEVQSSNLFKLSKLSIYILTIFFIGQVLLPLRHYFIKGDVLWTEEGHRLSWRMMLRSRSGFCEFRVIDKQTKEQLFCDLDELFTPKQIVRLTSPDMIWQAAQIIKKEYYEKGIDVEVYADCAVSINDRDYSEFVDPTVDLANVKWNYFTHCDWIRDKPF